jgi:NAD(P)-dependent dehydrogenase (short-subunit alcohol dehydrogenase family)
MGQVGSGVCLAVLQTDVSKEADCVRLVEQTVEAYGRLDVLVNNAAMYPRATLTETAIEFWRNIMAVNLESAFVMSREAVPRMLATGEVDRQRRLGQWLRWRSKPGWDSVAKGGLLTLTGNVAGAFGHNNIHANYLNPGWNITETEKVVQAKEGHDAAWLAQVEQRLPGGRSSVPSDAAHAILWLASDESIFVNGEIINTDGGAMPPNARRL